MASFDKRSPSTERPYSALDEFFTQMAPPGSSTPHRGADRVLDHLNLPSTAAQPQLNTQGSRDILKCDLCRKEHKKCFPRDRDWNGQQQKCDRCHRLGHPCGPQMRRKNSTPADNDDAIESSRLLDRRPTSSRLLPGQSSERITEHDFPQSTTLEQPQSRLALHYDGLQVASPPPIASSPYPVPLRRSSNPDFLDWELDQTLGKIGNQMQKDRNRLARQDVFPMPEYDPHFVECDPQASHSGHSTSDSLMQEFLEWKRQQELQKQRQQMNSPSSDRGQMTHTAPPRPGTPVPRADQTELYTFDRTPNTTYQSTPFFSNTAPFPGHHTFRVPTVPLPQHTSWQPQTPNSYTVIHQQADLHDFAVVPHDDEDITMMSGDEADIVHSKSPMLASQPKELELSEDQDYSAIGSVTDKGRATISSRYPIPSDVLERSSVKPSQKAQRKSTERHTCDRCPQNFSTINDLDRHRKGVHQILKPGEMVWRCKMIGCTQAEKIWPRKDNFLQHLKRMHFNGFEPKHAETKAYDIVDIHEERYDVRRHGLPAGSARGGPRSRPTQELFPVRAQERVSVSGTPTIDQSELTLLSPFVVPLQKNDLDLGKLSSNQHSLSMRTTHDQHLSSIPNMEQVDPVKYLTLAASMEPQSSSSPVCGSQLPTAVANAPGFARTDTPSLDLREPITTKEQANVSIEDQRSFQQGIAILGIVPPSDSGYASHKPTQNAHLDDQEQTEVVTEAPGMIKPTYAATSYTDNASLDTTRKETFVDKLAEQLVTDLGITSANASNALELCDEIVDILAEFALKLGYGTSVNELERARVFIHKYRKDIGSCFRSIVLCRDYEDDYDDDETRSRSDEMPLSDKMQMYLDSMIADPATELFPAGDLDSAIEFDQGFAPTDNIEDFDKYLAYVCKTPHYEWLLATSRCKIALTSNNETTSYVRQSILSVLPQASHARRLASHRLQTIFSVQWAPQELLKERWRSFHHASSPRNHPHDDDKEEADGSSAISSFTLGDILTITGESSEAQALSCSAYLTQTWPVTGKFMLQLLEEVIFYGGKDERSVQRTDGTQITVSQEDGQILKVLVSGTKDDIAEVGEQLAWLGAALRCSPSGEGAMYCTARIRSTESPAAELNVNNDYPSAATGSREARPRLNDQHFKYHLGLPRDDRHIFSFNIDFELEDVPGPMSSSGTCWKPLFQSPVIARGFPVMRRTQPSLGLEMPLNVMAGLLGTTYIHTFGGGLFLKGHSAILYPTQTVEDVIVWHLHFDSRGHYVHYPSHDKAKLAEIDTDRLAELRHVVGWCKVVENRTGIVEGNYKTERCNRLSWVKAGCVLEGCALSFGKSIVGGTPFTLLNDHDSLHITRKSYSTMLNYLSTRFVVFFDIRDRRGWLVNGINALYHILRTSLEEDKARSMQNQSSLFVLKPDQLVEPEDAGAASAAWQFLDNRDNIFCRISLSNIVDNNFDGGGSSPHKEVYETLGNRLEQFHDALEILFNYQMQAEEVCGRQSRPRAIYEGWDFVDVTRRRDQRPRMMKLPLEGMACVDLLRSARAITLFGKGFGELILPSSETFCRGWQTLPKMKYYIASSTADIQKLIKEEGESSRETGEPPQLSCVGRIMWFSPSASLDDCRCDTGDVCLAKIVQVPWPRKYRSLVKDMKGPGTLESEGAVVFGYNSLVPWHWPEIGDPRPGPPPVLVAEDSDDDSGLGSSIDSLATDQSTVTTAVPKSMLDYRRGYSLFPPLKQPPKTYGNANVSGGRHNHFGDSFHQIINNYQQQTTDIAVLGTPGLKHERSCGILEPSERTAKRKRLE